MKKLLLIIVLFCFNSSVHAQNLEWVYTAGGNSDENALAIAVDRWGNVYATGYFEGQVNFVKGAGTVTLVGQQEDIFVTKFNARGELLWLAHMGGPGDDRGNAIAVDSIGNVYTTGSFYNTADFNPDPAAAAPLTVTGGNDIFVSKLDSNGNYVWAKHFGSSGFEEGYGITVDKSGNVYTTGNFNNTVDFNPGGGSFPLTSAGSNDIFISKLDRNGDFVWAGQMGGVGEDQGRAIVLDDSGNIYTTGHFYLNSTDPPADFNPGAGQDFLMSNGGYDIFVSKLEPDGKFVWAKNMGGETGGSSFGDFGRSIAVDKSGHVYTTGYFQGTANFNPGTGAPALLTVSGSHNVFISKLDGDGNYVWANKIGGPLAAECYSIALDDSANILLTGGFEGIVDFDPGTDTANLISIGTWDIFVCKWDKNAGFKWALRMGSSGSSNASDIGYSITTDAQDFVYTSGHFSSIVDFDPGLGTVNRYARSGKDFYVHKMGPCRPSISTLVIDSICNSVSINGTVYTQSGNYTQTLQNSCGLDSTLTIILTVYTSPNTTVINDGITLTASQADSYQWIDCWNGNLPIDGEVGQVYTPEENGHYAVMLTGPGGCRDTSVCREFTKGVAVKEINRPHTIRVYPNPFTNKIHVVTERPLDRAVANVVNMMGQVVLEQNSISGNRFSIGMEAYPAGIYFLEVREAGKTARVKIVKQ